MKNTAVGERSRKFNPEAPGPKKKNEKFDYLAKLGFFEL